MATPVGRIGPSTYTLPGLRRRTGRCNYTGSQDPVVTKAVRSGSDPTMTAAGNVTTGAQRGAASRLGKASSLGSDSMVVSRRYNTVLEEMQAKWAKEQMEGLSQTPENTRKSVLTLQVVAK